MFPENSLRFLIAMFCCITFHGCAVQEKHVCILPSEDDLYVLFEDQAQLLGLPFYRDREKSYIAVVADGAAYHGSPNPGTFATETIMVIDECGELVSAFQDTTEVFSRRK